MVKVFEIMAPVINCTAAKTCHTCYNYRITHTRSKLTILNLGKQGFYFNNGKLAM